MSIFMIFLSFKLLAFNFQSVLHWRLVKFTKAITVLSSDFEGDMCIHININIYMLIK